MTIPGEEVHAWLDSRGEPSAYAGTPQAGLMRRLSSARLARADPRQVMPWETQPGSGPAARARMKARFH